MRHEPSDLCPPIQPAADRRCPSYRAVKPLDDFATRAGKPAGCCASRWRRRAAVARRRQQHTVRQVVRRAEAGYRVLLAQHTPQG
jgi:hypothetical protein